MKTNITASAVQSVSLSSLKHYPSNARRGDIDVLAESLKVHGQYRPVVVQSGTNYILAGNNLCKAMKQLGMTKVKAVMVECDEKTARKIVLVDNRTTDLANYNEPMLKALLTALPDLEGTGFSQADLDALDMKFGGEEQDRTPVEKDPKIHLGAWTFFVYLHEFDAWKMELKSLAKAMDTTIREEIIDRLGFPTPPLISPLPSNSPETPFVAGAETAHLKDVLPHPHNAREGDVGAIVESLKALGQYRPLVVNKRTMRCLSGNHTLQAMASLGWGEVAVSWVDVDDEQEIKILIMDNRASDLATYDSASLMKLIQGVDLTGTGFTSNDMNEILSGKKTMPHYTPAGRSTIRVGEYTMRVRNEDLNEWANTIYGVSDIVELLRLPESACYIEERQ